MDLSNDRALATLQAYETARERADSARDVQREILDIAIYDAREAGLSIREIAKRLGVPKSTVARHRLGRRAVTDFSPWATPAQWLEAWNSAWTRTPAEQLDQAPFTVYTDADGARHVALTPMPGTATPA